MGWNPIETAPKDGTRVLGAIDCGSGAKVVYEVAFYPIDGEWRRPVPATDVLFPTHWMPLPEPPK